MEWRLLSILSNTRLWKRRPNFRLIVRTVNLSFRYYGDSVDPSKTPVILMHGLLGNKKHMEGIGKTISNLTRKPVISLDLRNHGESPHTSSHKYTQMATDVKELMEKQNMQKATLLGHSMGGRAAMTLALLEPKIVTGLIVVDISPVSTCSHLIYDMPKALEAMSKLDFSKHNVLSTASNYAKKTLGKNISDDVLLHAILSNINVRKDGTVGWTINIEVLLKHFKFIAAFPKTLLDRTYMGPVLFIGGQNSDYLPPDDLPRIREIFPNSSITYIPDTGHIVYHDNPSKFMELVMHFIKGHS